MKKKYLIGLIAIVLCFTLVACGKEEKETIDYLVLVNKENKLPDNWEEIVELVDTKDFEGGTIQIEKKTLEQFNKLKEALHEEGVDIVLDSVYRSVKRQQEVWDQFMEQYGEEYTKKYVAVPGYSEHHTGLAVDVAILKDGRVIYDNDEMTAEREIFAKVHEKLADYGFILRFKEGKEETTGYGYEPWHFRYVGSVEVAKEIMSKDLTLEEYLESK